MGSSVEARCLRRYLGQSAEKVHTRLGIPTRTHDETRWPAYVSMGGGRLMPWYQ